WGSASPAAPVVNTAGSGSGAGSVEGVAGAAAGEAGAAGEGGEVSPVVCRSGAGRAHGCQAARPAAIANTVVRINRSRTGGPCRTGRSTTDSLLRSEERRVGRA